MILDELYNKNNILCSKETNSFDWTLFKLRLLTSKLLIAFEHRIKSKLIEPIKLKNEVPTMLREPKE